MKVKRFHRKRIVETCFFLLGGGYFVSFATMGVVSRRRDATLHKMRSHGRGQCGILSELWRSAEWNRCCGIVERNDTNGHERKCRGSAVLRVRMAYRSDLFLHR